MSGKDYIRTLKCLDIDPGIVKSESVDWLFCKPETNNILLWLCRYVNESNILTAEELYQIDKINENDGLLYDNEYDEKINEINETYSGVFEITVEEVLKLQQELNTLEKSVETLDKLTSNYLKIDYKIQQDITKLERTELQLIAENETMKNRCKLRSKEIDAEHHQIQKNVIIYSNILHNQSSLGSNEKYFITQMHLNNLNQLDEIFKNYLNIWIEKEFLINESKANFGSSSISSIGKEYHSIHESVCSSFIDKIQAECPALETTSIIEFMEEHSSNNFSQTSFDQEQKMKEIELRTSINMLTEEFNILSTIELPQAVKKFIRNKINSILATQAQTKYDKCCKKLASMKMLNNFLLESFYKNFLLVQLLITEKQKLQSAIKSLSRTHVYLNNQLQENTDIKYLMDSFEQDFIKYEQMPIIEKQKAVSDYLKILSEDLKATDIKDVLSVVHQRDTLVQKLLKQDLSKSENIDYSDSYLKIKNKIKEIKLKLWHGPTNQPLIISYIFMKNMYEVESYLKECKEKSNQLNQIYKETQSQFNDRWAKDRKLLPVWFLTEPKKVINAIQRIKEHIVGKPESTQDIPEGVLLEI